MNAALIGALVANIVLSLLVALLVIKKPLGYLKGFFISLITGVVFILLSVPFDSLTGNLLCGVVFLFLPKKQTTPTEK